MAVAIDAHNKKSIIFALLKIATRSDLSKANEKKTAKSLKIIHFILLTLQERNNQIVILRL